MVPWGKGIRGWVRVGGLQTVSSAMSDLRVFEIYEALVGLGVCVKQPREVFLELQHGHPA